MILGSEDTGRALIEISADDYTTCGRCLACVPLFWRHVCPDRIDPRNVELIDPTRARSLAVALKVAGAA